MASAFVVKSQKMERRLLTEATISSGEKSIKVVAQWDTGATSSCISKEVADTLGLVSYGMTNVLTPSGPDRLPLYLVDISLPNDVTVPQVQVSGSEIGLQKIGILIGMDIISHGDLAVTNYQGKTVFTFRVPSGGTIDFVSGLRVSDLIGTHHGKGKSTRKKK